MSDYFELGLYISPYTEGEILLSQKQDGGYTIVRRTCIDFIKTDIPQLPHGQYMLQIKAEGYKKYTIFFEVTDKWINYEETDIANPDNTQMKMPFENFVKMRIILTPKEEDDIMNCNKCKDKCENNNGKSVAGLIRKLNKNHRDSIELIESIRQKIKEKEMILGLPITLIDVDDELRIDVSTSDEYLDLDRLDDFIEELGISKECVHMDAIDGELIIKIDI